MRSHLSRLLVAGVLLGGALAGNLRVGHATLLPAPPEPPTPLATPPVVAPGAVPAPCHRTSLHNNRRFPETGQEVSGDFLNYWERNGALPDQGYPLSPLITEVSDLNGKPYQVQYFERAVFECHPENFGTIYSILLAQLGTFQYRQKYPQGAPNQRPNGENPRVFAETGHTLGGEFRTYWEAHGGKYQNGLPLSDEFTEVSALDGKPYTVQYFERAVFEYHPENVRPYRVLLSQLGTFRYRAKYPTPPGAATVVALPATPPPGPQFLGYMNGRCDNLEPQSDPLLAAGSSYLFWDDPTSQATLGYDVAAQRQLRPAQPWNLSRWLSTDGRTLAWRDSSPDPTTGDYTVHSADLQTGREVAVTRLPGRSGAGVGSDQALYYLDDYTGPWPDPHAISVYDGTTGQTRRIATAPPGFYFHNLVAGGGYVAWEALPADHYYGRTRLYVAPAQNPAAATLIDSAAYDPPVISGDHLFWTGLVTGANGFYNPATDIEVRMYTFSTRTTQVLDRGGARYLTAAADRVAWRIPDHDHDQLNDNHVVVLDLRTGQKRSYQLPAGVTDCVKLAGPALAYIRDLGPQTQQADLLPELYLQPLP